MLQDMARTTLHRYARWVVHAVAVVLIVVITLAGASADTATALVQPSRRVLTGDQFAELVVERGIDATNVLVEGNVILQSGDRIRHLVRCLDCTITGSIRASDVTFDRAVDLSRLGLHGALDLSATTFADAFYMPSSSVGGPTDLELTTFADQVNFDEAIFNKSLSARAMKSEGHFSVVDGRFLGHADFMTVLFGGTSRFDRSVFLKRVSFEDAQFAGPTSFQSSKFNENANFFNSAFDDTSDFTWARFSESAQFNRTRFRGNTTFRFIHSSSSLSFEEAQAIGDLNLEAAFFRRGVTLHVVSADMIILKDARISREGEVVLAPDYVRGLRMDVEMVRHVVGEPTQIRALEVLEETASADGDIAVANDARYALLALSSQQHGTVVRALDTVFYRGLTGYLVRPRHPLVALLLLFLLASSTRTISVYRASYNRGPMTMHARLARIGSALKRGVVQSTPHVFTKSETDSAAAKAEARAYAVVLALLLITIGNANPTVREVIDALHG